jgi:MoxR-like ATPase
MKDVGELRAMRDAVLAEVRKVVVGQDEALEGLLIALLAQGHALLEGVPGTAKTLMVRVLAGTMGLGFGRIQFTPDLMPSDIVGTNIFDLKTAQFRLAKGPIFTELLLADEINRAPAKTQSALLEAMQERQVSIDGERHALSQHFTVFATQNPVEQEGTYPLPEAQLDRFLLKIIVGYPDADEEDRILLQVGSGVGSFRLEDAGLRAVATGEQLAAARVLAAQVRVDDAVRLYIRDLVRATRSTSMILLGAGPRAGIHLMVASRWVAALDGRMFVTPDDIQRVLHSVVCHRLILAPEVELDGLSAVEVIDRISSTVPVPR